MNGWLAMFLIVLAAAIGVGGWEVGVTAPLREQVTMTQAKLELVGSYMSALRADLEQLANIPADGTPTIIFAANITEDPFFVAMNRLALELDVPAPTTVSELTKKLHGQ